MTFSTAQRIIDFALSKAQKDEKIQIGFFGGEPLIEFELIKKIVMFAKKHPSFKTNQTSFSITTNGTILTERILEFFLENNISPSISCDGPPEIHDLNRHFPNGKGSSAIVETKIKMALKLFPFLPVNAVYSPSTLELLPEVVKYLAALGLKNIFLSANITAKWTQNEVNMLQGTWDKVGNIYKDFYNKGNPIYINLIDDKIAVVLRGGFAPNERCRMGRGEISFSTSGAMYPCERLVDSQNPKAHCIGNSNGTRPISRRSKPIPTIAMDHACIKCELRKYCVNWCGCSNFFATGRYNRVGAFQCASEKTALNVALRIIQSMKEDTPFFSHHLSGIAMRQ